MGIGANIKAARKAAKLSQAGLARAVGVSENYVTQIETERKKPSLSLITDLSDVLSVPVSRMLDGDPFIERIRKELAAEARELLTNN